MANLICSRGLPASGKTSHALAWQAFDPENRAVVSRDGFRAMFHGYKIGVSPFETQITEAMLATVKALLKADKSVWVDGTNLRFREVRNWGAVAEAHNASWRVADFTELEVDLAVTRDAQRPTSEQVGEDVIRKMHERFIKNQQLPERWEAAGKVEGLEVEPYKRDLALPLAAIIDIDGTLALMQNRSPHDYTRVGEDSLNSPVANLVEAWRNRTNGDVLLVSGRPESSREATEEWLEDHGIHYTQLLMRSDEEHKNQVRDDRVKLGIFNRHIRHNYDVELVVDDRDRCVRLWRSLGLITLQAAEGRF